MSKDQKRDECVKPGCNRTGDKELRECKAINCGCASLTSLDACEIPFSRCTNCGSEFGESAELEPVDNLTERMAVGDMLPLGQCPNCQSLVQTIYDLEFGSVSKPMMDFIALELRKRLSLNAGLNVTTHIISSIVQKWQAKVTKADELATKKPG